MKSVGSMPRADFTQNEGDSRLTVQCFTRKKPNSGYSNSVKGKILVNRDEESYGRNEPTFLVRGGEEVFEKLKMNVTRVKIVRYPSSLGYLPTCSCAEGKQQKECKCPILYTGLVHALRTNEHAFCFPAIMRHFTVPIRSGWSIRLQITVDVGYIAAPVEIPLWLGNGPVKTWVMHNLLPKAMKSITRRGSVKKMKPPGVGSVSVDGISQPTWFDGLQEEFNKEVAKEIKGISAASSMNKRVKLEKGVQKRNMHDSLNCAGTVAQYLSAIQIKIIFQIIFNK